MIFLLNGTTKQYTVTNQMTGCKMCRETHGGTFKHKKNLTSRNQISETIQQRLEVLPTRLSHTGVRKPQVSRRSLSWCAALSRPSVVYQPWLRRTRVLSGWNRESRVGGIQRASLYLKSNSATHWHAWDCYAHLLSIISTMSGDLWIWQLSITMTKLGPGKGFMCSRSVSTNSAKRVALNKPSTIDANKKPSSERAGRIEKLWMC